MFDEPLKVYGVPFFEEKRRLERLPDEVIEKLPHLHFLGKRCPGGRVALKTDSASFTVRVSLNTLGVDVGLSLYSCQSAQIMVGERNNCRHIGLVNPPDYNTKVFEKTFTKAPTLEQITIYFPRNEVIDNIEIMVEDNATVTEPTPFKYSSKAVFYGSSITEGASPCCSTNAYEAILSRWLDFDFYNMGFSGNAKGELDMADYINTLDMDIFFYDYDHNAPTVEHLAATHKPFFERIRKKHPEIPVVMMTRPAEIYTDILKARREVVRATYEWARSNGDGNVYFIDGEQFYGEDNRNMCSFDNTHPNDLGFYRMSKVIYPVLKEILENVEKRIGFGKR